MFLKRFTLHDIKGDPISAERAYTLGLVNDLVEPGKAMEGAIKLAKRIEVNAPLAVREARNVSIKMASMSDEEVSKGGVQDS